MESIENQEDLFFGDLLQQFRQRKKLTQKQLAAQIGASRESVSLWERGQFKPETITTVHEIARVLDLDNDEKRLLFEAHLGTASILPLHNFPAHNPYFTGREEILKNLHLHLTSGKQVALIQAQAISGLGGIGKTQAAIEYAYRFREHYHDILWIEADTREMLMTSYLTLARYLHLREREERELHKVVEAVKRWLQEHKGWLLILDNIEDLSLVGEFVPTPRQGAVILTTRREETRPVAHPLRLEIMSEEEGILFLLKRAGYLSIEATFEMTTSENRAAAKAIVHMVGGLPLALDQAGAYIAETKCALPDYLDLFMQEHKALLQRRGTIPNDHPDSVTTTFSLAFERVQKQNKAAIELLKLCVYLEPDAIPLEIITEGATYLGAILKLVAIDALQLNLVLETLQAYSLVRYDGERHILSIHRLVQAVLRDVLTTKIRKQWQGRIVRALAAVFPEDTNYALEKCERLLAHVLAIQTWTKGEIKPTRAAAHLLSQTGDYLRVRGQYAEAKELLLQACTLHEQLGPQHLDLAGSLSNLAALYYHQGKYIEAEPLYCRALAIFEQQLGSQHPDTAQSLNNLALLYEQQGKYTEAEPLHQRALVIREQQLGPQHPNTAQSLNNLALLYERQGKYTEAESLHQRALAIREQALGPQHPETAISLNNLASFYRRQERYIEAEPLYQQALRIFEQQLGPDHPYVAYPLNGLANLYHKQDKYAEAEPLYQHALRIWKSNQETDHPDMAYPLNGLANLYHKQGKYAEAEPLYQHALRIREQTLELKHPNRAETLHDIARLREAQGLHEEARSLYTRALIIREQALGVHHPKTIETRIPLITLLHAIGQHEKAAQLEAIHYEQITSEEGEN